MSKFRSLTKTLKKNPLIMKLFNETALAIKDIKDSKSSEYEPLPSKGVSAGDDFGRKEEHLFEDFMNRVALQARRRG